MSLMMIWSLLIVVIAGVLFFDLNMAWSFYRNTRSRAVGGWPFIRWWAGENKVKLALIGIVTLIVSLALLLQGHTFAVPVALIRIAGTKRALWGGGSLLFVAAFVTLDLVMARQYYRNRRGEDQAGMDFYRWWFRKNILKFSIVGGVVCLVLGGAWGVNRYNNSLQLKSESSGYMTSAQQYYKEKKFREATLELRNAIKQNRGDYEAYLWLARSYWQLGSPVEARDAYRDALRIEPKLFPAHLESGRLAFAMKDPATAMAEAREAARLAPDQAEPTLLLAQTYSATGKQEQALAECRAIMGKEFASPELRQQLVTLLLRHRAFSDALQATDAGLKKAPHDQPLKYLQAQALEGLNRTGDAENLLRSIASESTSPEPCLALGDLKMRSKEYIAALKEYEEALKRAPNHERAMNNVASLNAEHGFDMERSAPLAARLYSKHPKDPMVADTLGWTLFRQGKIDTALPLLRQATVGMPGNPLHHYHLGVALLKNGQQDAGKKELAAALRISSTFDGAPQARDLMQQRKS